MQRNIFYAGWGWGAGIIMAALPEVCDSGWLPGSSYVCPYVFGGLTLLGIFVLVLTTVGFLTNQFLEHSGRVMTIPIAGMIFCGVAFLFFLAWHFAAPLPPPKIAQESLDQSNVPASSEQPSYAGSLRRMSPAKLREHVDDFGRELRTFENGFKDQYMKFILEGQQRRAEAKTEEEKQRMWTADSNQTILMSQRHNQEFQARFRGRGLAIQAELERRLETRISGNDREGAPLTLGMLAGPSPLADLAAWLSDYARQVPYE